MSGRRVVWMFFLYAAVVFLVLELYGHHAMRERPPDSPVAAARELVESDNTTVGLLGGVVDVVPLEVEVLAERPRPTQAVEATVLGARDTATLYADVGLDSGRWTVLRAALVLADGTRLPLEGEGRAALEGARP